MTQTATSNDVQEVRIEPRQPTLGLILAVVLLTGAHWWILTLRIPILSALPYWFFALGEQPIDMRWIGVAAAAAFIAAAIGFSNARFPIKIGVIIFAGAVLQFSFAYSKGNGLDGIRDRIVSTGHAQFAVVAVQQHSMLNVARNYEALVSDGVLGEFGPSKPPGTLLLYMVTERLANLGVDRDASVQRLESLRTFASVTWPVLSYLVLIPLFLLARELLDSERAVVACLLYVCIPSVNLITLHADQVFFPLLAVVPVALVWRANSLENAFLAFLGGVALYLAAFCSFALAFVALMMLVPFVAPFFNSPHPRMRQTVRLGSATLAGLLVSDVAARLLLNYDVLTRYTRALDYHAHWEAWDKSLSTLFGAGVTNTVEFAVWLGIPMSFLLIAAVCSSIRRVLADKPVRPQSVLTLALAATFMLILILGKTKAETARLWLFLVPFVCMAVAGFIPERRGDRGRQFAFVMLVLALELGTTYLTVKYQDFY